MANDYYPQGRDSHLWDIAKKRASFKNHLAIYLAINAFFWILWYLMGAKIHNGEGVPWPVWPMFGWGIGIVFHYIGAYVNYKNNAVEKEYEKLTNNKNQLS